MLREASEARTRSRSTSSAACAAGEPTKTVVTITNSNRRVPVPMPTPLFTHVADLRPEKIVHRSSRRPLLNHLVGSGQQRFRDGEAERLGRFHVDGKPVFGRRLYWQVGGLRSFENAVDIACGLSELADVIGADAIVHQATVI